MPYTTWNRVKEDTNRGLPDFEEPVNLTLEEDSTKDRIVTAGFLKSLDKSGPHWIFGIQDSLDPKAYTVIAWGEMPEPYKMNKD